MLVVEVDPKRAGRGAAQLAVPARPPHRRVRGVDQPVDRIMATPSKAALPHARRVGAARSHLARLAARRERLARKVRAGPLGLRRDRAAPGRVERVRILVEDPDAAEEARGKLAKSGARSGRVDLVECRTDRSWTRDYCPIFVKDAQGRTLDHRLALQRLGEVRQLAGGRRGAGFGRAASRNSKRAAVHGTGRGWCSKAAASTSTGAAPADHRRVPARPVQARNPELTRADLEARLRRATWASGTPSGCGTASRATTRTGTSTTWRASCPATRSSSPSKRIRRRTTMGRRRRTGSCCSR